MPALLVMPGLAFVASVVATMAAGSSMAAHAQPMPGGWMSSFASMAAACGRRDAAAAGTFAGMWGAMTVAMMLPSFVPALWRHRLRLARTDASRLARAAAIAAAGYGAAWMVLGFVVLALAALAGEALLQRPAWSRAVPLLAGAVVIAAGVLQWTGWKWRHLARCRAMLAHVGVPHSGSAWGRGWRLGLHCTGACANWVVALLAIGVMDRGAMAFMTLAVVAERGARRAGLVVQVAGILLVGTGAFMVGQAWSR